MAEGFFLAACGFAFLPLGGAGTRNNRRITASNSNLLGNTTGFAAGTPFLIQAVVATRKPEHNHSGDFSILKGILFMRKHSVRQAIDRMWTICQAERPLGGYMPKNTLTFVDVAEWLRAKAKELNRTADTLEQIMGSPGARGEHAFTVRGIAPSALIKPEQDEVARIEAYLKVKSGRAHSIAQETGIPKDRVKAIVATDKRFVLLTRGWVQLSPHHNGAETQQEIL